jgi:hypothetical protein
MPLQQLKTNNRQLISSIRGFPSPPYDGFGFIEAIKSLKKSLKAQKQAKPLKTNGLDNSA